MPLGRGVFPNMKIELNSILAVCNVQRVLAGLVFIPLLAYLFAPFRDMSLPFTLRLVFWAGVMTLALGATWAATKVVRAHFCELRLFARDVLFALLILSMFAPSLWFLTWVIFSVGGHEAPSLSTVVPYGVMFATGLLLVRHREEAVPLHTSPGPRLLNRLPDSFDGQIVRLSVRDHNVDVITTTGTFTIRSRFTDAIAEMEPMDGCCTHRSHWVVRSAIVGPERGGGKNWLRLSNGDRVPVSRKYKPMLEDEGIL